MPPDRNAKPFFPFGGAVPESTTPESHPEPFTPAVAAGGRLWTEEEQRLADRAAELVIRLGREVPCDEDGHWHSTPAAKRAHGVFACTACLGHGCAACDGSGFRAYYLGDERDQPLDLWWIDNALPGQPPARAVIWAPRA